MLNRDDKKFLRGVFSKYDYIMTTSQLKEEKLFYRDIQKLLNDGYIEKIKRGYYAWVEATTKTEVRIIKGMFPDAVLCMETALFYYRYSDRNPAEWSITIDKNVSRNRTSIDYPFVKAYRVEPPLVTLGETTGEIDYIKIRIYDRDRTICDILRNMNRMDKEIFNKAIQSYVKDPQKNIPNLMEYAKVLRVQKKVKDLIGVWL